MCFNIKFKTEYEVIKEKLHPFIHYQIDELYKKMKSERVPEPEIINKLQLYIAKTEMDYFKSLEIKSIESFSEGYMLKKLSQKYWSIYEFALFMSSWNTTNLTKECINFIINSNNCPAMANDIIPKLCSGVNQGHITFSDNTGTKIYNVNPKNLKSLAKFNVKVSDVHSWFEEAEIGIIAQIIIKHRNNGYKLPTNKGSFDSNITTREKTNCQNTVAALIKLTQDKWQPEMKGNKSQVILELVDRFGSLDGLKEDTLTKRLRCSLAVMDERKPPQAGSRRIYFHVIAVLYSTILQKRKYTGMNNLPEIEAKVINKLPKTPLQVQSHVKCILKDSIVQFNKTIKYDQRIVETSDLIKGF